MVPMAAHASMSIMSQNSPFHSFIYTCVTVGLKIVEPPAAAKSIPLGQKRKPGRPKKARAALVIQ